MSPGSAEQGTRLSYQYVVLRCVPRVDREEFLNVGVVLYCQQADFLGAAWECDRGRLTAFSPGLDIASVCVSLEFVDAVCAGGPEAGQAGEQSLSQRFGFLKAPRSTVVQPGPVHGGITADPAAQLHRLRVQLVD